MSTAENEDIKLFKEVLWALFILICFVSICSAIYIGIDTPYYFYAVPVVTTSVCVLILLREKKKSRENPEEPRTCTNIILTLYFLLGFSSGIGLKIISGMENLDFESIRQTNIGVFNFIEGFLKYSWDDIATQGRAESLQLYFSVIVYLFHSICIIVASTLLLPTIIQRPFSVPQEKISVLFLLLSLGLPPAIITILAYTFNDWDFYYRFGNPEYRQWYRYEYKKTGFAAGGIIMLIYMALVAARLFIAQLRDDTAGQETDRLP